VRQYRVASDPAPGRLGKVRTKFVPHSTNNVGVVTGFQVRVTGPIGRGRADRVEEREDAVIHGRPLQLWMLVHRASFPAWPPLVILSRIPWSLTVSIFGCGPWSLARLR
jgi:hypothetical protein